MMLGEAKSADARGEVFLDARGHGRAMRMTWHPEADVVVLSLWREATCVGTFRLPHAEVGAFIDTLVDSLRDAPGVHLPARRTAATLAADGGTTEVIPLPLQPASFADWAFGQ